METARILCCSYQLQEDVTNHETDWDFDRFFARKNDKSDDVIKVDSDGSDDDVFGSDVSSIEYNLNRLEFSKILKIVWEPKQNVAETAF